MSIVQLNCHFFVKVLKLNQMVIFGQKSVLFYLSSDSITTTELGALISSDNILQCRTDNKILLLQTQFFAFEKVIVWIKHFGDILGNVSIENGLNVVASVEHVQIETARGFC